MRERKQVFISHAQENSEVATVLAEQLEQRNYSTWLYERDQVASKTHFGQTGHAIRNSDAILVVLTPESCLSDWVKKEIDIACNQGKPIIPIRYGLTHPEFAEQAPEMHDSLGGIVELEYSQKNKEACLDKIVRTLRDRRIEPLPPPLPGSINRDKPASPAPRKPSWLPFVVGGALLVALVAFFLNQSPTSPAIDQSKSGNISSPAAPLDAPSAVGRAAAETQPTIPIKHGVDTATLSAPDDSSVPASTASAEDSNSEPNRESLLVRLNEFKSQVESYIKQNPVDAANSNLDGLIKKTNGWVTETQAHLDAEKVDLEGKFKAFDSRQERLKLMESELNNSDVSDKQTDMKEKNRKIDEFNKEVELLKPIAEANKKAQKAYNDSVEEFNRKFQEESEKVAEAKRQADTRVSDYNSWMETGGDMTLWRGLGRCYAGLKGMEDPSGVLDTELKSAIQEARDMRLFLAEHFKEQHESGNSGFLIVKTAIGNGDEEETCYMIVDNSSTVCCLSQEMVDLLDIRHFQGGQVEISLPNDLETHVPELLIPQIRIGDDESLFVKGVVMKQSLPGTDGSLGLSFLHRFDYTILGGKPPTISLRPFEAPTGSHGVFICHHADDTELARKVYDMLKALGKRPFLREMLPRLTANEINKAVDSALSEASDMVVVASDASKTTSPWVEAEWRLFERLLKSERQFGSLVTVIGSDGQTAMLPEPLSNYPVLLMSDPSLSEKLAELSKRE